MMDETNPYASPRADTHPPPPEAEVIGAWRDGDTLVLRRRGAVVPKACVKSNRLTGVVKYDFITFSNRWACLVLPLFFIPFIGFCVAVPALYLLAVFGAAARTKLWFRRGVLALLLLEELAAIGTLLAGNVLTGLGLVGGDLLWFMVGLVCSAIGAGLAWLPFSVLVDLRLDLTKPGLVCIRGAHPDYLQRLPKYDPRAADDQGGTQTIPSTGFLR